MACSSFAPPPIGDDYQCNTRKSISLGGKAMHGVQCQVDRKMIRLTLEWHNSSEEDCDVICSPASGMNKASKGFIPPCIPGTDRTAHGQKNSIKHFDPILPPGIKKFSNFTCLFRNTSRGTLWSGRLDYHWRASQVWNGITIAFWKMWQREGTGVFGILYAAAHWQWTPWDHDHSERKRKFEMITI